MNGMPALTPAGRIFPRYQTELYVLLFSPFSSQGFSLGKVEEPRPLWGGVGDGKGEEKMSKVTVCACMIF